MGRVACNKPALTMKQKANRKKWCNERVDWTVLKWKKIFFKASQKLSLFPDVVNMFDDQKMQINLVQNT